MGKKAPKKKKKKTLPENGKMYSLEMQQLFPLLTTRLGQSRKKPWKEF